MKSIPCYLYQLDPILSMRMTSESASFWTWYLKTLLCLTLFLTNPGSEPSPLPCSRCEDSVSTSRYTLVHHCSSQSVEADQALIYHLSFQELPCQPVIIFIHICFWIFKVPNPQCRLSLHYSLNTAKIMLFGVSEKSINYNNAMISGAYHMHSADAG